MATKRKPGRAVKTGAKKWSGKVTKTSNALDLETSVFKQEDAKAIAASAQTVSK